MEEGSRQQAAPRTNGMEEGLKKGSKGGAVRAYWNDGGRSGRVC
jgi:hypothetical protein